MCEVDFSPLLKETQYAVFPSSIRTCVGESGLHTLLFQNKDRISAQKNEPSRPVMVCEKLRWA